jgi:hypothetical protein
VAAVYGRWCCGRQRQCLLALLQLSGVRASHDRFSQWLQSCRWLRCTVGVAVAAGMWPDGGICWHSGSCWEFELAIKPFLSVHSWLRSKLITVGFAQCVHSRLPW